jgi:hypothetical protein
MMVILTDLRRARAGAGMVGQAAARRVVTGRRGGGGTGRQAAIGRAEVGGGA